MTAKTCTAQQCKTVDANTPTFTPRIDLLENDDSFILFADVPGVAAEDLEVKFEDGELSIHGKLKPRQTDVDYLAREYEVGDFVRRIRLGELIDVDRIAADVNGGVLRVDLPKTEERRPRKIEVKSA